MKTNKARLVAILLTLLLVCFTLPALGEEVTELTFVKSEVYLKVGQLFTPEIDTAPKGIRWGGFTYESSDPAVATVNRDGGIKGVAIGECTVTVTSKKDPAVTAVLPVHVVTPVSKITVTAQSKRLHIGAQLPLSVAFEPANATYPAFTYTSENEKIATVSDTGVVTGVKKGTVVIKVRSVDGKCSGTIELRVTQQPTSIELSCKSQTIATGRDAKITAKVLPEDTSYKNVVWSSSDTSIATVSASGTVRFLVPAEVTITATSEDDPAVSGSIVLTGTQPVQKIQFTGEAPRVHVGDTCQLAWSVAPENASSKAVAFSSSYSAVATVDENGVVTGLKPGTATITVKTQDGSQKTAKIVVHIDQPVTGAHLENSEIRIAVGYHGTVTAVLEPKDATNHNMSWVSSDPSIATVSGNTNKVRIKGHKWGDCVVTGTTQDGGYSVSITVHIGSYRFAMKTVSVKIHNGKPRLSLKNVSNLTITQVRYQMRGFGWDMQPIDMTTRGKDRTILTGSYDITLEPGDSTQHGRFNFYHPSKYEGMVWLDFCVTGISTADGIVYNVPKSKYNWITYTLDIAHMAQ